jgi:hypothetical protein
MLPFNSIILAREYGLWMLLGSITMHFSGWTWAMRGSRQVHGAVSRAQKCAGVE